MMKSMPLQQIKNTARAIRGFTLVELMITVVIISILAAIAYPSYSDFVMRSNRTEAQRELVRLANLQEQLFVDQRVYTNNMTVLGAPANPYLVPVNRPPPFYSITGTVAGRTFILSATATGVQLNDLNCLTLTINEVGLRGPAENCWE